MFVKSPERSLRRLSRTEIRKSTEAGTDFVDEPAVGASF